MFIGVLKNKPQCALIIMLLLSPGALNAWDFTDRIDGSYTVNFTIDNAFEVKKDKAGEYGRTYRVHPRGSKRFLLLMSVIKTPGVTYDMAFVREQVEEQGKRLLEYSAEKKLSLNEFRDGELLGYYFLLTEKSPKQDEYLNIMQGQLGKDRSLVTFTYLYNYENAKEHESIMSLVKSVRVRYAANTAGLGRLLLGASDLQGKCVFGWDLACKSIQVQYYFLRPNSYSQLTYPVIEKEIQSVERDGDKGSILFFRHGGDIESMKDFFTRLFYGPDGVPTDDTPEEFIISRDVMIIFGFDRNSALKKEVKSVILDRLK